MKLKDLLLKVSLITILGLSAMQAGAVGFEALPPTSGISAYVSCRSGNGVDNTYPSLADSACVIASGVGAGHLFPSIPEAGFSVFAAGTFSSSISYFSDPIATLNERVWRNASSGECIYGKQVLMSGLYANDYNPYDPGVDSLEANDFAFGGYVGSVSAAYAKASSNFTSVIRVGRTFTSVQRQITGGIGGGLCPGFLHTPPVGGMSGTEINGVGPAPSCSILPTAAQQEAPLSGSWVDFTTYASAGTSPDGITAKPSSPNMYIKQSCTTAVTSIVVNSGRIRQTGRVHQPWVIVTFSTRAPSTNITP